MKKNYIYPHNIVINLNGADAILNSVSQGVEGTPDGIDLTLGGNGGSGEGVDLGRQNNNLWDQEW